MQQISMLGEQGFIQQIKSLLGEEADTFGGGYEVPLPL